MQGEIALFVAAKAPVGASVCFRPIADISKVEDAQAWENRAMTDVSFAVMSLLMAVGLTLVAMKAAPLFLGRAFICAGAIVLCAHAIGIKIVAPISSVTADNLGWIALLLMAAMVVFLSGRGLIGIIRQEKSTASEVVS
jgi:hypothetical protein